MASKPRIVLKVTEQSNSSPETLKILGALNGSIENLHNYIDDFFESKNILIENQKKLPSDAPSQRKNELKGNLLQIEQKILEISERMKKIASEMSHFVDYRVV